MNQDEKGRIDKAEQAIVGLSGRMDGFDNRLTKVEETGTETNEIAHKLLARQGGYEATKGMIPINYLWSAMALFVALATLGTKMLWDHDQKNNQKIENVVSLQSAKDTGISSRFSNAEENIEECRKLGEELRSRILAIETSRFRREEGQDLFDRLSKLEVESARNDERVKAASGILNGHTGLLDHPSRQTYQIEGLLNQLEAMRDRIDALDKATTTHRTFP